MARRLVEILDRWCDLVAIENALRPAPDWISARFPSDLLATRPGVARSEIAAWERRHGYTLPEGLEHWLTLSNGFFADGPLIHPLSAIGPMVPFARVPGLVMQPESWFELGNPNVETVCLDLAYRWPSGGFPVFTSGDDERRSPPRVIAPSFEAWFLGVLASGGREYWFASNFRDLGDPWLAHRRNVPAPLLDDRLRGLAERVSPLIEAGIDDRAIAARFGISPFDVEEIVRHVQHTGSSLRSLAEDGSSKMLGH
jgi:hypothetical protein